MTLVDALVHAAVVGAAMVLPISASGHGAVTRIWRGQDAAWAELAVAIGLGAAIAMAVAVRSRLGPAGRALGANLAKPSRLATQEPGREAIAVVIAATASTAVAMLVAGPIERALDSPTAVGLGLLLTALALGTTAAAPAPKRICPTAWGSLWLGLAHGLGTAPGVSRIGAAFVVANWLGVRGWRAAEFALMVTAATASVDAARGAWALPDAALLARSHTAIGLVVALIAASLAAQAWRWLSERRRTLWLVAWLVPLAVATLGYSRAAPTPQRPAAAAENIGR
ncbi:MAG: UDP kinase [Deltaproteobacteria bacterium]|jgi:undecaprenyl pyrophosphate phosphatase UppP|nr:UDP kinase [Deltaproteobacteria bacterium]MBW2535679.1 UDP kinase [Deltaproteobacteria bacterium]